ncbi:MAG: mevalonate kinase [Anaerolineae bacterium]
MTVASAAGKVILLGEHAVVYGRPAIAVPLSDVRAVAEVTERATPGVRILAADLGQALDLPLDPSQDDDPLQVTVRNALERLGVPLRDAALQVAVRSEIPIARGLGSGTAVATAIVRALATHHGAQLAPEEVSELVFRTEILLHGSPSGVDNTVVAYERPVYFKRGTPVELFDLGAPLHLVVGDTGIPARTRDAVADVRRDWSAEPALYERLFDEAGGLVDQARQAVGAGDTASLGRLMDRNQALLLDLGVSSPELDRLVAAARSAGALGAKLSGGGRGGCMVALATPERISHIMAALQAAGAAGVVYTTVQQSAREGNG